jgi:hypothetical protein
MEVVLQLDKVKFFLMFRGFVFFLIRKLGIFVAT